MPHTCRTRWSTCAEKVMCRSRYAPRSLTTDSVGSDSPRIPSSGTVSMRCSACLFPHRMLCVLEVFILRPRSPNSCPAISVFPLASLSISGTFLVVDWFRVSVSSVNTVTSVLSPSPGVLGYYSFAYHTEKVRYTFQAVGCHVCELEALGPLSALGTGPN